MPFYTASKATFEVGGKEFPRITWYKEPGIRGLYVLLMLAVLTSATNGKLVIFESSLVSLEPVQELLLIFTAGYDGSMMNGLQSLGEWKDCKL